MYYQDLFFNNELNSNVIIFRCFLYIYVKNLSDTYDDIDLFIYNICCVYVYCIYTMYQIMSGHRYSDN